MTVSELIDALVDLPITSQNLQVVIHDSDEDGEEDYNVIGLSECSLIGTPAIRIDRESQMPKLNHIHKYKKELLGHNWHVFRCVLPDCPHYVPVRLAIGRVCICWRCGAGFVLTGKHIKLTKPHCDDCTKRIPNDKPDIIVTEDDVAKILGDLS